MYNPHVLCCVGNESKKSPLVTIGEDLLPKSNKNSFFSDFFSSLLKKVDSWYGERLMRCVISSKLSGKIYVNWYYSIMLSDHLFPINS